MKLKMGLVGIAASLLFAGVANASTLRVVVVEVSDVTAYVKSLETGQALLKKNGSAAQIRSWVARYAGADAGSVIVSVEYPDIEALAKDDTLMRTNPEVSAWLAGLGKLRKVLSDSIYQELKP